MLLIQVRMEALQTVLDDFNIKPDRAVTFQQPFESLEGSLLRSFTPELKLMPPFSVGIHDSSCCLASCVRRSRLSLFWSCSKERTPDCSCSIRSKSS